MPKKEEAPLAGGAQEQTDTSFERNTSSAENVNSDSKNFRGRAKHFEERETATADEAEVTADEVTSASASHKNGEKPPPDVEDFRRARDWGGG